MGYEMLEKTARSIAVESEGGCEYCGFMEQSLIGWRDDAGHSHVHCDECFQNVHPSGEAGFHVAYLPELSIATVSHYVRALSLSAYANKIGLAMSNTSLQNGLISADFPWSNNHLSREKRSEYRFVEAELKEAKDRDADAWRFLKSRIAHTTTLLGSHPPERVLELVGSTVFSSTYRVIPTKISFRRIQSWATLSTFAALIKKEK